MLWFGLTLATMGFALLALAMDRHHQQLWHREPGPSRRWRLRTIGVALLAGSLLACVHASGWSTGLVEWVGLLTVSALGVVLLLTYLPNMARMRKALYGSSTRSLGAAWRSRSRLR